MPLYLGSKGFTTDQSEFSTGLSLLRFFQIVLGDYSSRSAICCSFISSRIRPWNFQLLSFLKFQLCFQCIQNIVSNVPSLFWHRQAKRTSKLTIDDALSIFLFIALSILFFRVKRSKNHWHGKVLLFPWRFEENTSLFWRNYPEYRDPNSSIFNNNIFPSPHAVSIAPAINN